ncbi:hypothetical protein BGW42_001155 [Actinomortierella wolfii]|nr:hypothetical protein BGW42_001155 [Actinomortierella wolfii]
MSLTTTSASTPTDNTHEGIHLVVLQHGLWGTASHVKFIEQQFKQRLGDRLCVYRARANESKFTYDGIDLCAVRLVEEIHTVIKVIEEGDSIEDMKGQRKSKKKQNQQKHSQPTQADEEQGNASTTTRPRKVTQFSYLGYSLGGLIGRFAMGLLEMEQFFTPTAQGGRGIEPVYFVTMATPHLGIRTPSKSRLGRLFNFLSARMLSRTGEQLQLVDSYLPAYPEEEQDQHQHQQQQGQGVPILVAMSEPGSVFVQALARFKKRAIYCNIRNDRSVPFWTASFSDADPFKDLDTLNIQYHSKYSSLIESFEHLEQALEDDLLDSPESYLDSNQDSALADSEGSPGITTSQQPTSAKNQQQRRQGNGKISKEAAETLAWHRRLLRRIEAIPWKRVFFFGVLAPLVLPIWLVIASSAISYQGIGSRIRTKTLLKDPAKVKELEDIRQSVLQVRQRRILQQQERQTQKTPMLKSDSLPNGSLNKSESRQRLLAATTTPKVMVDTEHDHGVAIEQQQGRHLDAPSEESTAALAGGATAYVTNPTSSTSLTTDVSHPQDTQGSIITLRDGDDTVVQRSIMSGEDGEGEEETSFCYPHIKSIRPLNLLPAQKEISRHLHELEWIKNIVHIEAFNAHASIVVRETRFSNEGGVAVVQHAVDMFIQDCEDE